MPVVGPPSGSIRTPATDSERRQMSWPMSLRSPNSGIGDQRVAASPDHRPEAMTWRLLSSSTKSSSCPRHTVEWTVWVAWSTSWIFAFASGRHQSRLPSPSTSWGPMPSKLKTAGP
jgi:hypothetical protein